MIYRQVDPKPSNERHIMTGIMRKLFDTLVAAIILYGLLFSSLALVTWVANHMFVTGVCLLCDRVATRARRIPVDSAASCCYQVT